MDQTLIFLFDFIQDKSICSHTMHTEVPATPDHILDVARVELTNAHRQTSWKGFLVIALRYLLERETSKSSESRPTDWPLLHALTAVCAQKLQKGMIGYRTLSDNEQRCLIKCLMVISEIYGYSGLDTVIEQMRCYTDGMLSCRARLKRSIEVEFEDVGTFNERWQGGIMYDEIVKTIHHGMRWMDLSDAQVVEFFRYEVYSHDMGAYMLPRVLIYELDNNHLDDYRFFIFNWLSGNNDFFLIEEILSTNKLLCLIDYISYMKKYEKSVFGERSIYREDIDKIDRVSAKLTTEIIKRSFC